MYVHVMLFWSALLFSLANESNQSLGGDDHLTVIVLQSLVVLFSSPKRSPSSDKVKQRWAISPTSAERETYLQTEKKKPHKKHMNNSGLTEDLRTSN